jgi:hypothetical protein
MRVTHISGAMTVERDGIQQVVIVHGRWEKTADDWRLRLDKCVEAKSGRSMSLTVDEIEQLRREFRPENLPL